MERVLPCKTKMPTDLEIKNAIGGFGGDKFYVKKGHQLDKDDPFRFFKKLRSPKPGNWLWDQHENGQDYASYCGRRLPFLGENGDTI